ncbi:MAG: hypothetical protein KGD73_04550 [Candidatus Lokiarchaeota archaeon]|nr:hypothetical protein [Candidatus Lokiarchaeota archaeon]
MALNKWLSDPEIEEMRKKKEEMYNSLPEEQIQELKKESIRKIKRIHPGKEEVPTEDFSDSILKDVIEFKNWVDSRTYLKGDTEKIETWIKVLYKKMISINKVLNKDNYDQDLDEEFRKIPVDFLDEQTRLAVIKKLRNTKRTNSDNYFLRKLKLVVEIKIIEAKYYKILKRILD